MWASPEQGVSRDSLTTCEDAGKLLVRILRTEGRMTALLDHLALAEWEYGVLPRPPQPPASCSASAASPCSDRFPSAGAPVPTPRSPSAPSPRTETQTSIIDSPSKDRRMSHGTVHRYTFIEELYLNLWWHCYDLLWSLSLRWQWFHSSLGHGGLHTICRLGRTRRLSMQRPLI